MRPCVVLCCVLAISCGSSGAQGPSDLAGGGLDGPAPWPDGGADVAFEAARQDVAQPPAEPGVDAAQEVRADALRDVLPSPIEVGVAGPCGAPGGPACPVTYRGTVAYEAVLNSYLTGSLASDGTLYIAGGVRGSGFDQDIDFDPTAGLDARKQDFFPDGFVTKLGPTGTYGQTWVFAGAEDANNGANVTSVAATSGGVLVLGGYELSIDLDPGPGVDVRQPADDRAMAGSFLVKLTSAGALVWGRTLDSPADGSAWWYSVAAAPDGAAIVTGSYRNGDAPVDLDPGPGQRLAPNNMGIFVSRFDANKGDVSWVRTFGGGEACENVSIGGAAVAADGTTILVGDFRGTCAFDQNGPTPSQGDGAMFVAAFAPGGKLGGVSFISGNLGARSLSLAPDGSIYLAGTASTSIPGQDAVLDFDPGAATVSRMISAATGATFVLKLDASRAFRWVELLDPHPFMSFLAALPDNGVVIAMGPGDLPVGMSLIKLDANHNESWHLAAGGRTTVPYQVLAGGREFLVLGGQSTPGDLDPTAGVDRFDGKAQFVSRYGF